MYAVLPSRAYRRYFGRHEDESEAWWTRIAARVPVGAAILDIGAYRGQYALAARQANAAVEIHGFEANPKALQVLRPLCDAHRIHVVEAVAWNENGRVRFSDECESSHILAGSSSDTSDRTANELTVDALTLDSWVTAHGLAPALIKIDAEGAEAAILSGATRTLARFRPVILCEVLSDSAGKAVKALLPEGYRFYHINENGGIHREAEITRVLWRNKNWLFVPVEDERIIVDEMTSQTGAAFTVVRRVN
jgi:FkbM family methyltransferase